MGYAFSQWFWSFAGELVVAIFIGVAAMIWGLYEGVERWSAAINALIVVAAILLIINQSGWWEPPAKVKIHKWLDDMSFAVREIKEKDELEFQYEVTFRASGTTADGKNLQDEHKFYVQQSKKDNALILLEAGLDVAKSFPKLMNLPEKEVTLLRSQIVKDLMLKGVAFGEVKNIYEVRVKYMIPVDALSQHEFIRGFFNLWEGQQVIAHNVILFLEK